jgi:hypothetical protein
VILVVSKELHTNPTNASIPIYFAVTLKWLFCYIFYITQSQAKQGTLQTSVVANEQVNLQCLHHYFRDLRERLLGSLARKSLTSLADERHLNSTTIHSVRLPISCFRKILWHKLQTFLFHSGLPTLYPCFVNQMKVKSAPKPHSVHSGWVQTGALNTAIST